jgi:nicotinamide-nucleotide amidase
MRAEILTIGDEILIGQIINTNSVWIAQELNMIGIKVLHMASVSDERHAILKAFDDAASRSDIIFITGGLGPTKDDITKKVIAEYFNTELVIDENVLADVSGFFTKRGREVSELNRLQALVPKGCTVIRNPNGTAPSMWLTKNKIHFISMPGVPYEMKAMMSESILPQIKQQFQLPIIYHKTVLTQGIGESQLAEMIENWEDALVEKNIKLAYLPQPGIVRLRLSTSGQDEHILRQNIETAIDQLKPFIEQYIYGYELYGEATPGLEKIIADCLLERKQTLALAESCTGGFISSLFTAIPGISEVYKGGVVPYSNEMKQALLHTDIEILETHGAVSKACVLAMAQQTQQLFNCDYALAVSGIAGPSGGTEEKPVGLVWVAVTSKTRQLAMSFQFGDNRQRNILMSSHAALNLLRKFILKHTDKGL